MPRYVVEREFPSGLQIPVNQGGALACRGVIDANALEGVTWVHSYVSTDHRKTYCVYDAATPDAIRRSAARNSLPIAQISEVQVLDPYFYHG